MKYYLPLVLVLFAACAPHTKTEVTVVTPRFNDGASVMVYKTTADYSDKVPVMLSEDGSRIVSYPDPTDIKLADGFPKPEKLEGNYLLDKRGINKNTVFLNISYEDYAKLPSSPSLDEMYSMIIVKKPLLELCNCGNKDAYKDIKGDLNSMIRSGQLRKKCKVIL